MKTVPLHGKKAAGRVVRVDDGDYELVSQYRWNAWELAPDLQKRPGRSTRGPYAVAMMRIDGRLRQVRMHCLIMGITGVDHIDHDGLNNQRYNLRPATKAQNNRNKRSIPGSTSQYKGVSWLRSKRIWVAAIRHNGLQREMGRFASELQAAYAYDAAARELFGEFAYVNFPDEPTQAMRDEWRLAQDDMRAERKVAAARLRSASVSASREHRATIGHICENCGAEYESKASKSRYCSKSCNGKAGYLLRENRRRQERREREAEGRLF
jgi:hypothetical protein